MAWLRKFDSCGKIPHLHRKYSSRLDVIWCCPSLFVSFDKILSLAVKNIEVNFILFARLFVSLNKILSLAVKNIEVNFILFCSLIRIFEKKIIVI